MTRLTTEDVMNAINLHGDTTRHDLADRLKTNSQTVRYHLRYLMRRGMVVVTRTTATRASPMKWYGSAAKVSDRHLFADSLRQRLDLLAEGHLKELLDQWGKWSSHGMPNAVLEDIDLRVKALTQVEQIAVSLVHNRPGVWCYARINQAEAYRAAIDRLLDRSR